MLDVPYAPPEAVEPVAGRLREATPPVSGIPSSASRKDACRQSLAAIHGPHGTHLSEVRWLFFILPGVSARFTRLNLPATG